MKIKRVVAMTLVALLLLPILAGCKPRYEYDPKNIRISKGMKTDVCKLGSPITIEETVAEGWDEDGQAIMESIVRDVKGAGVTDGMLQVDAIRRINNYLCEKVVYTENKYCRTPRGPFLLRQAVCVGYSLSFMYIAQYCGIDAVYVHGFTKTSAHGWNGVYFSDGSYFEVDVTMNDTSGDWDKYLLLSPEKMEELHFA